MQKTSTFKRMAMIMAVALMGVAATSVASAQALQVATGGKEGTYARMLAQINGACSSVAPMIETNTSGSQEALEMLMGNTVNMAFVQTDVLHLRARTEDTSSIKALMTLHPEAVHILVRSDQPLKAGGVMGIGGKDVPITELSQLAGLPVGAVGGSYVTAQVMRLHSEVPFSVVPFNSNDDAIKALDAGKVRAVLMVGGAPFGAVAKLTPPYQLVGIGEANMAKLKSVYKPAKLTYSKLGAAGVPTAATEAVIATRDYKTERMSKNLLSLRSCLSGALDDMKERTGTHPAWQQVKAGNKGNWAWYEGK